MLGPVRETAMRGLGNLETALQFGVDVLERRRDCNPLLHAETESMSLPWSVVWILANNDHFHGIQGGEFQRMKDVLLFWVDCFVKPPLLFQKGAQMEHVRLL